MDKVLTFWGKDKREQLASYIKGIILLLKEQNYQI